ncbi:MAG: hypothetical protein U0872_00585 [Planctomycetaceae bacterium]
MPIAVEPALVDQGTELLRLKQAGVAPKWAVKPWAQTATIPASVNLADLTTVVARDGSYRTEAIYTIKNRRRQFLALRLPEGVSLLSAMLGDQPARCVTATMAGKPAHLIALPKTSEADLSFEVKVVLSGVVLKPLPARNGWRAEDIDIPAPQVISQAEEDAFGIPVARTRWTVYLAEDLDASGSRDAERNNLTFLPEGAGDALSMSAVLQEFNELLDVMSMSSSVRNRKLAESNLKQLESALLRSDGYSYSGNSPESEELAEQQRKALDRFEQLQSRGRAGRDLSRRAQPGEAALPALNFSGQSEVLAYTIQQNNITLNNNSGNGIVVNEAAGETFQLRLQEQAAPESDSSEKSAPQQRQSDFEARGESQRQNTMNLEGLNVEIGRRKGLENTPKDTTKLGIAWEIQAAETAGQEWAKIAYG